MYCKWFLENDPIYSKQLKRVWLWKEWPNNWGRDKGIDLIAETPTGEFWAIQAKCYDQSYYVTKEDVDKFLSESSRSAISYRLLICTTDLLGDNAREVMSAQEKQVGICSLENLLNSSLTWPSSVENLQPVTARKPKTPRPHQEKAIKSVMEGFTKHDMGQLYMACGTGKTLVSLWLAEQLKSQNTLVLVPSISLVSQIYQEWAANATINFIPVFVCSDPTVSDKDQMVTSLYELGFPTTTDPEAILKYLSSTAGIPKVIFSTYHSSPVIKEICALNPDIIFDITIADEAHRCAGAANSDFATLFEAEAIKSRRKLFMTATPKIFSDHVKTKAQELEYDILSMDDEARFGPVFYKLPFSSAIAQDLLSDYEVLISIMDDKTYREYAEKGRFVAINRHETDARTVAAQILISKAIKSYELKRIITFHNRKTAAHEFINTFPISLNLVSENERPTVGFYGIILGDMYQSKRKSIMKLFERVEAGSSAVLANVRCLSEGVDVPTLDGVAFIDPKGSEIEIVQAVGRAIRKAPNKKKGLIILPVFIDSNDDHEINLEESCFKPVWKVLNALRAHDDILAEELDQIRLDLGRRTYKKPPKLGKITIDLPVSIGIEFSESLKHKIVETCSAAWEFYYGLLLRYVDENEKAPTSSELEYSGYNLGSWISIQRKRYNAKQLDTMYIKRLEALPGWSWDALEAYWTQGLDLLKEFYKEHSHLNVPFNYCIGDFNLSSWVSVQRRTFKKNKMSAERQIKLESIPGWTWRVFDGKWEMGISMLSIFYEREKHVNVPIHHVEQSFKLGLWIRNRKADYSASRLESERRKILEAFPGWNWESVLDISWNKSFNLLLEFAKEQGHSRVPMGCKYKGFSLDVWVSSQRRAHHLGKLPQDRKRKLESLPGWSWNTIKDRDETAFQGLDVFVQRENHALVPTNHIENGFPLGKWVSRQRLYYNEGKLEEEFILKLEGYTDWFWDANEGYWERGKRYLFQHCEREGSSQVKNLHLESGFALGKWVQMYRYIYKKGNLSQDKIDFFNSLPGWSWDVKADQWKQGFEFLKKFVVRTGHARVPSTLIEEGFTLGTWVNTQRYTHSKGKLSQEKVKLLESLPAWTWSKSQKNKEVFLNDTLSD